jgi:hypothetical protein
MLSQAVVNTPTSWQSFWYLLYMSSEEEKTGRQWLQEIEALRAVMMNTVAVTVIPDLLNANAALVCAAVYGMSRTHNIGKTTRQVMNIIGNSFRKDAKRSYNFIGLIEILVYLLLKQLASVLWV